MSALQVIWFFLVGVLLIGYAILDGFDLGVGFWYAFTRRNRDKRALRRAIGPYWDGNEVWLLTGGGAIFAAFPHVYATVFSGFYLALIVVLLGLILRAVSLEFRDKHDAASWHRGWDAAFVAGSVIPALLFGVALGNILRGLPLDDSMNFTGSFFTLLNPYALLVGVMGFAMLAMHGAVYLTTKTRGDLLARARGWAMGAWAASVGLFIAGALAAAFWQTQLARNFEARPALWAIPLVTLTLLLLTGLFVRNGRAMRAFLCSSLSIVGIWGIVGAALFPNLVPALGDASRSLTIWNASSSQLTLTVMLIIAGVGMPIVLGYTIWVYRLFGRSGTDAVAGEAQEEY
ncbi:MAG: cytochrome d ubiquinol oxidase subunit II [Candidatus Eisenbacteria bacterium]|nr:cytochrome d ubiquinol oxidase subunit II [Candidatus Eisenbacteria bacterium]